MRRYEAHGHPDSFSGGWDVTKDGRCPRRHVDMQYSEAEANIIAFALNAVAEGKELYKAHFDKKLQMMIRDPYDGPTEGVAP